MPSLSVQINDLVGVGPVLEVPLLPVRTNARQSRKQRARAPELVAVTALIDTGATSTVLKRSVAETMGLKAVDVASVHTASSADVLCVRYDLRLVLRRDLTFDVRALGLPMDGQNIDCLIGRDVLAKAVFLYLGRQNQFVLAV
jgi:predicted aspartyl protease